MLERVLVRVKTGLQVVDRLTVLNGDDSPSGEGSSVSNSIDLKEGGGGGVTGTKKVTVQRVHAPSFDRSPGGHESLGRNLAPEGALTSVVGVATSKNIDFDSFEVEKFEEKVEGLGHVTIVTGRKQPPGGG
jgi:hypothetical protein